MKIWAKIQLNEQNKEVENIAKSLTNYIYNDGPIQDITRKYSISREDKQLLDQYSADRIAGILLLYFARDYNRINDIVNKYNTDFDNIKNILPKIEGYIEK